MLRLSTNHLRQIRLVVALAVVLLAAMSLPLLAQAPPSGDTFVSSSFGKSNFGSSVSLVVQPGATTFIQFNLSGVPAGASVTKATLRLYVDAVGKSGSFDVYQLNNSWNENTLTYNTPPPALGASATGGHPTSITSASYNQFLLIDITALVQGWLSGAITNNGVALALISGSQGSFSFDSKESLFTSNGPELEIAFNSGTGPQGPQGPAGPVGPQGPQGVAGAVGPTGPTGATGAQGATGLQGAQGPLGPMGLTGAQGLQGVAGPQGAAGTGFNFLAAFDNTASYAANDVVSYNGSSYVAKSATNPGDPAPDSNPNWSLMAQQGAAGPTGAVGPSGPIGLTGATGATGAQGPQGPGGPAGPQGQAGAVGPQGLTGPQGPQGPAGASSLIISQVSIVNLGEFGAGFIPFGISGTLSQSTGDVPVPSSGTISSAEVSVFGNLADAELHVSLFQTRPGERIISGICDFLVSQSTCSMNSPIPVSAGDMLQFSVLRDDIDTNLFTGTLFISAKWVGQ